MRATAIIATGVVVSLVPAASGGTGAFKPLDGRYVGHYTSANHGAVGVSVHVGGFLRPQQRQLPAVQLVKWSGKLRCPGHRTRTESAQLSAARIGRDFSGYVFFAGGKISFTGTFLSRNALRATVRVKRSSGSIRCDTGPVRFSARRAG